MDANLGDSVTQKEFMSFLQLRTSPLLSVDAVADWVHHGVRLPQYAEAFRSNAVSLLDFPALANHERLVEDLGVSSRLHRDQLCRALKMQVLGLGKVPGEPKGLLCNATSGGVSLQWDLPDRMGVPPLHKFTVERKDDAFGPWKMILPNVKDPYVVDCKGVEPGHEYQYRVTSWGIYGGSVPAAVTCRAWPPCDDLSPVSHGPCMNPCASLTRSVPALQLPAPQQQPALPLQAEPAGGNASLPKRGWLLSAMLGPDATTWSLWRAFLSFQSAMLTLGLILRGSAIVRAFAGAAWTGMHSAAMGNGGHKTPTRSRSRAPSVSSHSGRRESYDGPFGGSLHRRSRSNDTLPSFASESDLTVNLGDMASGRVLSRWGTLRAALRMLMLMRGHVPEDPTPGHGWGNGAGGGGGVAAGGAKMPPLMEHDEKGHEGRGGGRAGASGPDGNGNMVRIPSSKSFNSVKSSSLSMLSEVSLGLDPDLEHELEMRHPGGYNNSNNGPMGLMGSMMMGTLGEAEQGREADVGNDRQLRLRSSKHDKYSRYRCKVDGCKARFDRWYKVQDWEMVFRKHFCKECQWVFCSKHTRISPHGSTGRCGLDSRCYCENCFNALPANVQAILERTNKLRPELSSPKAPSQGPFSGAGNSGGGHGGGGSGGSPRADAGVTVAVATKSKPKRGGSMRALLPSAAWFGQKGNKSTPQLSSAASMTEGDGKDHALRSNSDRDMTRRKTEPSMDPESLGRGMSLPTVSS
eukprot:jgi/Mesvir1/14841/Mv05463-RA.2